MITLAIPAQATEPGWAKLIALLVAVGLFWVFTQVHKRFKAVKDGTEVNPFSPDDPQATQTTKAQVKTSVEAAKTTTGKGAGKWFRKG